MAGSSLPREDYKTAIPQLSAKLNQILSDNVIFNKKVISLAQTVDGNNQDYAYFKHLTAGYFEAIVGDFEYLSSRDAYIEHLEAEIADIGYINADTIAAHYANLDYLEANYAHISNGVIDNAKIGYADVDHLEANYASIDLANVNNGWIQNGLIKNAAISDAQIIGVSANKLTTGTIDAGVIHVINLNASNLTVGTINGQRIGNGSIDLAKLAEEVPTKEYLDQLALDMQNQIDGAIETYTGSSIPTLNNYPASNWYVAGDAEETYRIRHTHVGDVYFVQNAGGTGDGYSYRFSESNMEFSWVLIRDSDITAALARITAAEGDIGQIKSFDSAIGSWKTDTDEELSSLKGRTSSLETTMGNKVNVTTFNEVKQTVEENSATITTLTEMSLTTPDGETTTNIKNIVNKINQTATTNKSSISGLETTVGDNSSGLVKRVSDVTQDLDGFKTTVSATYATQSTVDGLSGDLSDLSDDVDDLGGRLTTAESSITHNADNIALKVSTTDYTGANIASLINQSADEVKIQANHLTLNGEATFNVIRSYSDNAYASKAAALSTSVSLYYRSTTNSAPSISASTTIGTSATTDNAWEYVMPQPKRDRYFFTCERYVNVNGDVTFSTVRELTSETYASKWVSGSDNTYIDGGRIYANSITSNQIDASSIHVGDFYDDGTYATPSDVAAAQAAAAATATSYLSIINGTTGISVHDANNVSDFVNMNSTDGVSIYRSGNRVAQFASSVVLGDLATVGSKQLVIDNTGLKMYTNYSSSLNKVHVGTIEFGLDPPIGTEMIFRTGEDYTGGFIFKDFVDVQGSVSIDDRLSVGEHIYVMGHDSPIGTVKSAYATTDKTVRNETGTALCSISLEAGKWLCICGVRFEPYSGGIRRANLSTTSGSTAEHVQVPCPTNNKVQFSFTRLCQPGSTTTYYLNAYQTSGVSLTCASGSAQLTNYITAIRLE